MVDSEAVKPKKVRKQKAKSIGRPRKEFNQAVADRICEHLVSGKSLRRICTRKDMPGITTVLKWLREEPEFAAQYARSREEQADAYADELLELGKQANSENAHAIRVRADILKWVCSKLKPKAYGDRLEFAGQVALKNAIDPNDPRVAWKKKTLQTWTDVERLEATREICFCLASMGEIFDARGFDPKFKQTFQALSSAAKEAVQGGISAVTPQALPAPQTQATATEPQPEVID